MMGSKRKNKTVVKLRKYRDKLIAEREVLNAEIRESTERFSQIRHALQKNDSLRAYALAGMARLDPSFYRINTTITELTILYRYLVFERDFTQQIYHALMQNDLLRARALIAQHVEDAKEHDKNLYKYQAMRRRADEDSTQD